MAINVVAFVKEHGFDNCGFLTITFPEDLTWQEAQRRFNNYRRRVLGPLFPDYIRALEFTKRGRPHYHLVVACHGDIRTGFNFDVYEQRRLFERTGERFGGRLNRNALLVSLHKRLNSSADGYGVGRQELVPLRTCAEAVGRYIGGYLSKGLPHRLPEHKGARFICYSRSFSRAYKGNFSLTGGFFGAERSCKERSPAARAASTALSDSRWRGSAAKNRARRRSSRVRCPIRSSGHGSADGGERQARSRAPPDAQSARPCTPHERSEHGREWRMKLKLWAERHGCFSLEEVRALFGPRWAYHHWDAILAMDPATAGKRSAQQFHPEAGELREAAGEASCSELQRPDGRPTTVRAWNFPSPSKNLQLDPFGRRLSPPRARQRELRLRENTAWAGLRRPVDDTWHGWRLNRGRAIKTR